MAEEQSAAQAAYGDVARAFADLRRKPN